MPEESPVSELEELAGAHVATVVPASRTRAARGARRRRRARRRDRLGRGRAAARARRRDRRPRFEREHAADERPALARVALRVARRCSSRAHERDHRERLAGDPALRRRGAPQPVPDAERARRRARPDPDARARLALAERAAARGAGMVALHALVPADDVWRLLPKLEEAGASSILLVPVERMISDELGRRRDRRGRARARRRRGARVGRQLDGVAPARAEADAEGPARRAAHARRPRAPLA